MFKARKIETFKDWSDKDGLKIYTISTSGRKVVQEEYAKRLKVVKEARSVNWSQTPAFVIFHEGESCPYLVLVWWMNDNELFISVSVFVEGEWIEDPSKYSFCIYDLDVIWAERKIFIETYCCKDSDLVSYQKTRMNLC